MTGTDGEARPLSGEGAADASLPVTCSVPLMMGGMNILCGEDADHAPPHRASSGWSQVGDGGKVRHTTAMRVSWVSVYDLDGQPEFGRSEQEAMDEAYGMLEEER